MIDALRSGLGGARLPVILQTEAAECGLPAWRWSRRTTACRRPAGAAAALLVVDEGRHHGRHGAHGRPDAPACPAAARRDGAPPTSSPVPCILHWDLNHFVVLKEVRRGQAVIHDPARGVRRIPLAEVSRHFTGVVLELSPQADFQPVHEREPLSLRQLLGRVTGLKRSLGQIFALALALEAFVLLTPFFMQWVVDGVLVSADRDLLVTLGIGFALLVLLQVATGAVRSWAVLHLSSTLNLQWLNNVFAHLMRLPVDWFEKRHTGDVPVALRRRAGDPEDADHQLHRGGARRRAGHRHADDDVHLQRDAELHRAGLRGRVCAAALGLLPTPARRHRRGHRARRQACQPLPRVAARRAGDQTGQPPGRPPGAFHEPGGRRDERRHRHPQARTGVRRAAQAGVRAGARGGDLGRRAAGDGPALLGRHAVRVLRLQGAVRAAHQRPDRQGGRAEDAAPAGRGDWRTSC